MTEKQLRERDAKRDLGAELLQSIREMKAGKGRVVAKIEVAPVVMARMKSGLSRPEFASGLGVSVRTLQDWEQGRRQPSGAARTSITIAEQQPKDLKTGFDKHVRRMNPTMKSNEEPRPKGRGIKYQRSHTAHCRSPCRRTPQAAGNIPAMIYFDNDNIVQIRVSDKPIARNISLGWNPNLSYAKDGSIVEIVLLDAKIRGLLRPAHRKLHEDLSALIFGLIRAWTQFICPNFFPASIEA